MAKVIDIPRIATGVRNLDAILGRSARAVGDA